MAQYPQNCDVYMPSIACPFRARGEQQMAEGRRRAFGALTVFGRLKPGVTVERAAADVAMVANRFNRDFPAVYEPSDGFKANAVPLLQEITRNARPMLLMIMGATVLVLLLACANVASLTLARTLHRERELALRVALGAGRGQLAGQLLTESVLLALGGGVLGLVVARLMLGGLTSFIGRFTARTGDIHIDLTVLLFTLGLSILTGLAFGALPALIARPGPAAALKQAGPSSGGTPRRRRLQSSLVVAQVAVSVVLLVGAGLFLTSFYRLQSVETGYQSDRVISAEVFGNFTRFKTADDFRRLYLPIVERLERIPGIVSASVSSVVPLGSEDMYMDAPLRIEGQPVRTKGGPTTGFTIATQNYFDTLRIAIVSGRGFLAADTADSAKVALVNKALAHNWGSRDPIGTRISVDEGETWMTVVGVTANVRQFSLEKEPEAQVYIPLTQSPMGLPGRVLVRTQGDEQAMSQGHPRRRARRRPERAREEHQHARGAPAALSLAAPAHGGAAGPVRGCRAGRDADRPGGRDGHRPCRSARRSSGPAGPRRAACRARARRPPPGRRPADPGRGARHRGRIRCGSRADAVPLRHGAHRPAHVRGRGGRTAADRAGRLSRPRAACDVGRSAAGAQERMMRTWLISIVLALVPLDAGGPTPAATARASTATSSCSLPATTCGRWSARRWACRTRNASRAATPARSIASTSTRPPTRPSGARARSPTARSSSSSCMSLGEDLDREGGYFEGRRVGLEASVKDSRQKDGWAYYGLRERRSSVAKAFRTRGATAATRRTGEVDSVFVQFIRTCGERPN
jgi:hypothetical protein